MRLTSSNYCSDVLPFPALAFLILARIGRLGEFKIKGTQQRFHYAEECCRGGSRRAL